MKCCGVDLYETENGLIGVLISPCFGAGWSTWNDRRLAFDKRIIEKFLKDPCIFGNELQLDKFLTENIDYYSRESYYLGGTRDGLRLEFVPKNTRFIIEEYDGSESIHIFNPDEWIIFGEEEE